MEKNGSHYVGLCLLFTGDPPQCAVGAHGEQIQMSAVSPGVEEACPGSVRSPLLCALLQAAHQVDGRSSDHLRPCEMQKPSPCASPLTGHASARPVFLFLLTYGNSLHPEISYLMQTHPSHDWTLILKANCKDLTLLTRSKGVQSSLPLSLFIS